MTPKYGLTHMKHSVPTGKSVPSRLLPLKDAATYLSSTTRFVEELVRDGKLRFTVIGKRRVIDIRELDAWVDEQSGSTTSSHAITSAPSYAHRAMEILTPEEVAKRLKVKVSWIYEKRRPRAKNPIPCLPLGRYMRFDWNRVLKWLNGLAADDSQSNPIR
jgi:excisionase family DNA binding protein